MAARGPPESVDSCQRARTLAIEPYCILCRAALEVEREWASHFFNHDGARNKAEPWTRDVFCFFDLSSSQCSRIDNWAHIFRANLTYSYWEKGDTTTKEVMMKTNTRLDHQGRRAASDLDATANLVHSSCLLLMKHSMPSVPISAAILCVIARLLRPLLPWQKPSRLTKFTKTRHELLFPELSTFTPLGSLVTGINKLPLELQGMIHGFLPENLFASLSRCSETLNVIKQVQYTLQADPKSVTHYTCQHPFLGQPSSPRFVSANTVQMLGERCLTEIGMNRGSSLEIPVKDISIQAVQYALGTYGVVALRLLYVDNSYSPWLGNSARIWVTTLRGNKIQNLMVVTDGFKTISVQIGDTDDLVRLPQMLWSQQNLPSPSDEKRYSLIDTRTAPALVRGNLNCRLGHFLPLRLDPGQNNSLTMFCSPGSVSSIQLNDKPRLGSTHSNCTAVTFYLRPEETIESVHVVTRGEKPSIFKGPYLLAITSNKRSLFYAPHALLYLPDVHFSNFTDEPSLSSVSGIFINPSVSRRAADDTVGVELLLKKNTSGAKVHPTAVLPNLDGFESTSFVNMHAGVAYLSTANLCDLKTLKLQKIGSRCRGLFLHRSDDSIDILGQWDPTRVDAIKTVYDQDTNAPPHTVTFVYSDDPEAHRRYIKDILMDVCETTDTSFKWTCFDKDIAWWYTFRYDFVESWAGGDRSIDMTEANLPAVAVQ